MRAPFNGTVRRKPLSVIVRGIRPPMPLVGDKVDVMVAGELVRGRVLTRLGMDTYRIALTQLDGSPL